MMEICEVGDVVICDKDIGRCTVVWAAVAAGRGRYGEKE